MKQTDAVEKRIIIQVTKIVLLNSIKHYNYPDDNKDIWILSVNVVEQTYLENCTAMSFCLDI